MPTSPPIALLRPPSRRAAWSSRDAATDAADRLKGAFAVAARASARLAAPDARRSVAVLEAAVRACAARWKAAGLPPEQVLIRVSEATRRHALDVPDPRHAATLRDVVFCAFLRGYYGDARAGARSGAPRDAIR